MPAPFFFSKLAHSVAASISRDRRVSANRPENVRKNSAVLVHDLASR